MSELSKLQNLTPAANDGRDSGSGPQLFVRSNSQYDDLIACDQQRAYMEFFQSAHTCDVCFKDLPGESFCEPCGGCHIVVCKSCLIQSCKVGSPPTSSNGSYTISSTHRAGLIVV